MKQSRMLLIVATAVALSILSDGVEGAFGRSTTNDVNPDNGAQERRLQPYACVPVGRYVHGGHLSGMTSTCAGNARAQRWELARHAGLKALIIEPQTQRGAYRDAGAVHSAWR